MGYFGNVNFFNEISKLKSILFCLKLETFQSMNKECISYLETKEFLREPFIYSGYRPVNRPFSYYAKSIFTKHNETINVWSHYIGCIYILSMIFEFDFNNALVFP